MSSLTWPGDTKLKLMNRILLFVVIVCNGYVLILPLLPKVDLAIKQNITKPVKVSAANANSLNAIDRSYNHLILPSIQLDAAVFDGPSIYTVNKGVWRRPNTSTPDQGGNTVLVGHRFTYQGQAVFYNLDKLSVGDEVYLAYGQKLYHYKVDSGAVVSPNDSHVEAPTQTSELTIYTCTPLITAKNRLVYVAKLIEVVK